MIIKCGYNGNPEYKLKRSCKFMSVYDEYLGYEFNVNGRHLMDYREINQKVRAFIKSKIVRRVHYSEVKEQIGQ